MFITFYSFLLLCLFCNFFLFFLPAHYLRNLKSQLPHSRMLAISALNTLLQGSSGKSKPDIPSVESTLTHILQEEGFLPDMLNSLSHVHIISDTDSSASKGPQASSFQSGADKAMTFFYFDFSASWPRTPSWISLVTGGNFYSSFARIFKRLVQECGTPLVHSLQVSLDEFLSSKERSKQCVAAEAMAGMLHSDVSGIFEEWDSWMMSRLEKVVTTPSVESVPEWAACVRYAVTGKGKHGTKVPALRQKVLDSLAAPVLDTVATSVVAKRYSFLAVCLIEVSAARMGPTELQFHVKMLEELLENMRHSSAQVLLACSHSMDDSIFLLFSPQVLALFTSTNIYSSLCSNLLVNLKWKFACSSNPIM